eukprot:8882471-Lingulodinium_polyedra.AAC.1
MVICHSSGLLVAISGPRPVPANYFASVCVLHPMVSPPLVDSLKHDAQPGAPFHGAKEWREMELMCESCKLMLDDRLG